MCLYQSIYNKIYGDFNIWSNLNIDKDKIDLQGWGWEHEIFSKFDRNFSEHIYVDVGVWKGKSSIELANNMKTQNINGVIISVDTFLGSIEHFDYIPESGQPNYAGGMYKRLPGGRIDLYETFINNVACLNLNDIIIPFPQTSNIAAAMLKLNKIYPTFVHIDASHNYLDVKRDISDYYDILVDNGILVCDDYNLEWHGVYKAVNEFSAEKNIQLTISNNKAILVKSK